MATPMVALLDGTIADAQHPLVHVDDMGLLRGDGIFETTLAVDREPRDLEDHLARMRASATMLDLTLPAAADWRRGVAAVLAGWSGDREAVVRLICTRGRESGGPPTAFVMCGDINPHVAVERRDGVSVVLLDRGFVGAEVAGMPWLLAGAKTLSYALNMAARRYAVAQGSDDVIFIGRDGRVLEGPTATVVIARGRTLLTPPVEGILAGVTVRRLFRDAAAAGWETVTAALTPADLASSDGVWLVSGVRLLAPVNAVDGARRPIGEATEELARVLNVP